MSIKSREPSEAFRRQVSPNIPVIKKKQRSWRSESDEIADPLEVANNYENPPIKTALEVNETSIPHEKDVKEDSGASLTSMPSLAKNSMPRISQSKVKKKVYRGQSSSTANLGNSTSTFGTILIDKELILKLAQGGLAGREVQVLMFMLFEANGNLDATVSVSYADISATTGIIPQHISLVLGKLIEKNFLLKESDQTSRKNSYRVNRKYFVDENLKQVRS